MGGAAGARARRPRRRPALSGGPSGTPSAGPSAGPSARRPRGHRYLDDVAPLVAAIPRGRVLTYGDVAELTGWGAARAVGAVMSRHGHELPWWRVVRADGTLPEGLLARARLHWADEGAPLAAGGGGVDLPRVRWDAAGLAPDLAPGLSEGPGTVHP